MNRRGILKALFAAPAALPVIARDAAAKAGIHAGNLKSEFHPDTRISSEPINSDVLGLINKHLKRLSSSDHQRRIRLQYENQLVRALDPDLASSRAFSLSAAHRLQKERNIQSHLQKEKESLLIEFKTRSGLDWFEGWFEQKEVK